MQSTTISPITAILKLASDDNVVLALRELTSGERLGATGIEARELIPAGHKVAIVTIPPGQPIRKYGQIIGFASVQIEPGSHVHVHNVMVKPFERDAAAGSTAAPTEFIVPGATFQGIVRADGRVATRNYLGVVTTVNCSATAARHIADRMQRELEGHPTIDGVVAITHTAGCGMAAEGEAMDVLRRTIGGYAAHPNFAGVLLLGLGCEDNQVDRLMKAVGLEAGPRLQAMTIQDAGGTAATVARGMDMLREMVPDAAKAVRTTVPAGELKLALQCGGSDGYSGISANPALGACADLLVRNGGTAVLSETPEIYGAEHLLTRRAQSADVAEQLLARIRWWEAYTARNGGEMNNNPSPGNKAGGLTTILEKSLGAVAKGGSTNLVAVNEYAEPIRAHGLVFMDTPGYDPVSATGQVAGGANMICFTTGRGSVFGAKPAPSIKIATNSALYKRMSDDMDVNCGPIADGEATVAEKGREIFELVLRVASGEPSKSEALGFGDSEFAPWVFGAVM
jgi:altronate hydrolase